MSRIRGMFESSAVMKEVSGASSAKYLCRKEGEETNVGANVEHSVAPSDGYLPTDPYWCVFTLRCILWLS